jgi:hypothetical protein
MSREMARSITKGKLELSNRITSSVQFGSARVCLHGGAVNAMVVVEMTLVR